MTRVRGRLEGLQGPLNGRLYIAPTVQFIGAPEGELVFRIKDGEVDIELPPCPAGAPYAVDWRNVGDTRKLSFPERWKVPPVEEVELDHLRGYKTEVRKRQAQDKGAAVELVALKAENEQLAQEVERLNGEKENALRRISSIEAQLAAATGQAASAQAALLQQKANAHRPRNAKPIKEVIERRVEVGGDEWKERLGEALEKQILLQQQNEALQKQLDERLSLANHFGTLHDEIDRLKSEKQRLLMRVEELKQPRRTVSSFRAEAIAELDKLAGAS